MTRSLVCLFLLAVASGLLVGLLLLGQVTGQQEGELWQHKRSLVALLGITDLSLSSEARYTRHVSQADLFSAFQDFPASFEHFPTGSMLPPRPSGYTGRVLMESSPQAEP